MGATHNVLANQTVGRIAFDQATWASGVSAAVAKSRPVHGCCEQLTVKVNNNTGNRTATVTITDENGATLFTQAGIAENATTTYFARSYKAVQDANFNPFLAAGLLTATITPSDDPGVSGMTVDVELYLR